jgi:hypothetical protein
MNMGWESSQGLSGVRVNVGKPNSANNGWGRGVGVGKVGLVAHPYA